MPAAATVNSFQGREADIMVVILRTTKEVGPGFTVDKNRLNVMLSRQKSGLLVFGDLYVLGKVDEQREMQAAEGRGQGRGQGKQRTLVTLGGATHFVKRGMLDKVLQNWADTGRVVELTE
ncbi:hypothetical protein TGAM01_v205643 [Trichoderma gamsii]|uniref:DNA2/NAM7 helicase-like C-terminal domain-containing protein n=1 Tax=Trichoderma gamsii TaxID=398673 RepID=A0A2P4ZM18_9HYPO|nr:hypothetical protein TGAM01_v205643 [Trichoderma gamsii]PON25349.1 hypothetical protein TGAM01_v205643 [Trichoderma gamsii]